MTFSSAIAIVRGIELMKRLTGQIGLMFTHEFSIRLQKGRLIHGPLLNRMLFLLAMKMTVSCTSIRVKIISIGMEIIPSC